MWDIIFNPKKRIIFMQMVSRKGHHRLKSILLEDSKKIMKAVIKHPFLKLHLAFQPYNDRVLSDGILLME